MKFVETPLRGAFVIEPEPVADERGFFARVFCEKEFAAQGLQSRFVQCSVSFNRHRGTLRGLHFQATPHAETKLVSCTRGAIHDVIVDLREDSNTRHQWYAVELSAANHRMMYVPEGFAHGFQSLLDESEVFYQISVDYNSSSARGIHHADADLAISWPLPVTQISERDRAFARLHAD